MPPKYINVGGKRIKIAAPKSRKRVVVAYKNTIKQSKSRKASPFPLGQHLSTKLKSAYNISVAPATYYYNHLFNLNSLFDPDRTTAGTNKQPLGFDELAGFFQEYQVYSVKLKVRFVSSADTPVMIGFLTTNTATNVYSTTDEIQAAPGMSNRIQTKSSVNSKATTITRYVSIHNGLGITKNSYDDVSYLAEVTASPSELLYGQVVIAALDGSTTITGQLLVSMVFYCKFTKRKQLSLS